MVDGFAPEPHLRWILRLGMINFYHPLSINSGIKILLTPVKKPAILGSCILFLFLAVGLISYLTGNEIIPGVMEYVLIGRCKVTHYIPTSQSITTITIDCPRVDSIRIWPLPIIHPGFEDWRENNLRPRVWVLNGDQISEFGPTNFRNILLVSTNIILTPAG